MELHFALLHFPRLDIFPQLLHYACLKCYMTDIKWKNMVCSFSPSFYSFNVCILISVPVPHLSLVTVVFR